MKTTRLADIKRFFSPRNSIIRATAAFLLSLVLIIWPELLSSTLIIILGALMIVYALFDMGKTIYDYCKTAKTTEAKDETEAETETGTNKFLSILKNIKLNTYLFLLIGILLIALKNFVLTAAMIILAIALLLSAMIQLWATVSWMSLSAEAAKTGTETGTGTGRDSNAARTARWIFLSFPIISMILAIVILSNPFGSLKVLLIFTGSSLMFFGVTEIARTIYFKATHQDTGEASDETPKLLE